jgi:3-mercaptopyruvate sulfurtransferase SseA
MKNKTIYLAVVAVGVVIGLLWFTNRAVTPKQATWEDVLQEAKAGGYRIIKTEELAERYQKNPQDLLLVDTRQEWEFRTGHLQGAVNFSMEPTAWSRWRKQKELAAFLGPDKNRFIVFY